MLLRISILMTLLCLHEVRLFDLESRLEDIMLEDEDNDQIDNVPQSEPIKFKINSLRDCNDRKDLIKFKRLWYSKTSSVPGFMEVNGSALISEKLPSDWNIAVNIKMKTYLGFVTLPCIKKCNRKNVCSSGEFIRKCQELFTKMNETSKSKEYCKCDYDKGLIEIPPLKIPLEFSEKRRKLIKTYSNSKEVKVEIVFKSAHTDKRFACFRGIFQMIK